MHELSIAMSILDVVEEEMVRHPGARVSAIHVRHGELSGVVKDALVNAYELAREATPFAGAKLVFEDCPIVIRCARCDAERTVHSLQRFCCAVCDAPAAEVLRGRELELAAIELEE